MDQDSEVLATIGRGALLVILLFLSEYLREYPWALIPLLLGTVGAAGFAARMEGKWRR